MTLAGQTNGANRENLERMARELLLKKSELILSLTADYEIYLDDLSDLEIGNRKLASAVVQSSDYIGEHILWIQSTDPLSTVHLRHAAQGLKAVASPILWAGVGHHVRRTLMTRPVRSLTVCLLLFALSLFHVTLRNRMVAVSSTATSGKFLRFTSTIRAVGLAAIISIKWPLLLAYIGWILSLGDVSQSLAIALSASLLCTFPLLWVGEFVLQLIGRDGVAESNFEWSATGTKLLRTELFWLTFFAIPLAGITVCMQHFQDGRWSDSTGRLAFVASWLVVSKFMHSIFHPQGGVLREAIARDEGDWLTRFRSVSHAVGAGVPITLAVLAIAGYYYSAEQLALRWVETLAVAIGLLFVYSMASRWCKVKRRNLAVKQARERQRFAAGEAPQGSGVSVPVALRMEDQQPDLSAIHEQLRYLLRHAVTVAMLVSAWFIWSGVLPALKVLDGVVLWQTMAEVTEIHEAADGTLERTTADLPVKTTLRHALFAFLLIMATFVIGGNLPALLEVTVLQSLPFDKGVHMRYLYFRNTPSRRPDCSWLFKC